MSEDRSEAATPRRLQKARDEGNVAISREAVLLASLGAGGLALMAQAAHAPAAVAWFASSLHDLGADPTTRLRQAVPAAIAVVLPVAAAAALAASGATMLQTGFLLRLAAIQPDLARLSPLRGLGRLFGLETAAQAVRAVLKLAILAFLLWFALLRLAPGLAAAIRFSPAALWPVLLATLQRLALPLLAAQIAIAIADLAWVRYRHNSKLRMSRQQVRDEHRETEGNPEIKQRLRQLARRRARRRMMAAVPNATLVITNPEHYAVALAYQRGSSGAPRLVAKGADNMAARIRETARAARVPLVANPPLARALYRLELDTEIPPEHFRAVAEIVAYIWRLGERAKL